jgi:4-hydroxythreonine-4-phosphate dehydrogenase
MKNKSPILIVLGEPYSVFSELIFKIFKSKFILTYKRPIILIGSEKLLQNQMVKLGFKFNINKISQNSLINISSSSKSINIINVNFDYHKPFDIITKKSNEYIENCFNLALHLIKKNKKISLINGPVSKKHFLKGKFQGITEYLAKKTKIKKNDVVMLIYNKNLSVSPVTTHLPLKLVHKKLTKLKIINHIKLINKFYKENFKKVPKIAVTGLNPHCESNYKSSEEDKIIIPSIKYFINKKFKVSGPFPADTIFMKNNIKNYDVILGMYHDQVLTPAKTLFEFDAINVTLGLPFIRISPDHGPNETMVGKNISNPSSLLKALEFLSK